MARLPNRTRETLSFEEKDIYDRIAAERKDVPSPFKVMLNSPGAAKVVADLGTYVRFHTPFSAAVRELVILTVARWFDSLYEWGYHEPLARKGKANAGLIERIRIGDIPTSGDTEEIVAVRFAHELISRHDITKDTFEKAKNIFGESGVVDLITLTGHYVLMAIIITALKADLEPGMNPSLPIPAPIKKL